MSRRWPTRPWRLSDGIGTAVYVGDDAGIVTKIAPPWPGNVPREMVVAFSAETTRPVLFIEVDVIDEAAAWDAAAVLTCLREAIRRGPERVAPATPKPRRVHQRVERWAPLVGTWTWGRSPTGVYVSDGGDSMRDVWRPPPLVDAELALLHVVGPHRGLVELDRDAAREAAGYVPDTLERVMEVIL